MDDSMDSVMTPQSYEGEDSMFGGSVRGESVLEDTPAPEKKPVKKRKSWGQQLPEPKTNLPPRKRAKTEDEKEQRRVERVLRNRRAAQSSRERKRQEVEALEAEKRQIERRNQDLEMRLAHQQEQILSLQQALQNATGNKMHVFGSPAASPAQELRRAPSPVTFSQELFSSRDPHNSAISTQSISDLQAAVQTVNPASLSPEMRPVADSSNASSSDMTQHPAAMFILPIADNFKSNYDHMVGHDGAYDSFDLDEFLIHDDPHTSEMRSSDSPNLARPLMDATMAAMRSASEQQLIHDCLSDVDVSVRREDGNSPSVERLMTLLWTIHVIEKERTQKTTKLDAATEVRQACDRLDMFRPENDVSFSSSTSGTENGMDGLREEHEALGKKSLADWRMAFTKRS
ncbi:putative transcriptional activator hac1 [Glarea lozoyensis 74030]|uniref:Putative transcriptional activator hac1 n=1 Tax=Glarea lozoyensis (strain ATCC 74030 / MF5533) TaxID=1104152 RepID=H0EJZ4_GLAL7|nr:putative transcriptional activator hac1 [Glarea lozoyensis 74030]